MYNVSLNFLTIWPSKCNLNEWVSFHLNNLRIKTQPSEERELQILTKYVLSFIIISLSTLSRLQLLSKIDDSRCRPLFYTLCSRKCVQYGLTLPLCNSVGLHLSLLRLSAFSVRCSRTSGIRNFNLYGKGCILLAAINLIKDKYLEGSESYCIIPVLVD